MARQSEGANDDTVEVWGFSASQDVDLGIQQREMAGQKEVIDNASAGVTGEKA